MRKLRLVSTAGRYLAEPLLETPVARAEPLLAAAGAAAEPLLAAAAEEGFTVDLTFAAVPAWRTSSAVMTADNRASWAVDIVVFRVYSTHSATTRQQTRSQRHSNNNRKMAARK